jgi:hypothetical protein
MLRAATSRPCETLAKNFTFFNTNVLIVTNVILYCGRLKTKRKVPVPKELAPEKSIS